MTLPSWITYPALLALALTLPLALWLCLIAACDALARLIARRRRRRRAPEPAQPDINDEWQTVPWASPTGRQEVGSDG